MHRFSSVAQIHPILPILIVAFALRVIAVFAPGFAHPDEIYQYLEPAHRLLTGEGIITWEWRAGMRSWLLPLLLSLPMAIGRALDPAGDLYLILPRMSMAAASLAIVASAWAIGTRQSRLHAVCAATVTATWFEIAYFGARTLSEPLATAAIFPALVLLTDQKPGTRGLITAGLLLGLASLLRPHYAVPCAVIAMVAGGRALPGRLPTVLLGGLIAACIGGAIDIATGSMPFAWIGENFHQNIVEHRAVRYGAAPPLAYIARFETMWRWWAIPLLIAVRFGYRSSPALFWGAIATLALHSMIDHKEYRFVFLAVAGLITLAGLGTADLVRIASKRWPALPPATWPIAAIGAWIVASLILNDVPRMQASQGRAGTVLAQSLRADPALCGIALYEPATFADMPGLVSLPRGTTMSVFMQGDSVLGRRPLAAALANGRAGYNRIITTRDQAAIPAGYVRGQCSAYEYGQLCIYARTGGCADDSSSPFRANTALPRWRY